MIVLSCSGPVCLSMESWHVTVLDSLPMVSRKVKRTFIIVETVELYASVR